MCLLRNKHKDNSRQKVYSSSKFIILPRRSSREELLSRLTDYSVSLVALYTTQISCKCEGMDLMMSMDWRYSWIGDIHGSKDVHGFEVSMDLKISMDLGT